MRTLIVIDMQDDFIGGSLSTPEAVDILPNVKKKIREYRERGDKIVFTRDTHFNEYYFESIEGKHLPIKHCIAGTVGWQIPSDLISYEDTRIDKYSFGYDGWHRYSFDNMESVEIIGLCTDICVISNALILKAYNQHVEFFVDASCCAGTTPENHKAALQVMKACQINIIGG